MARGLVQRNFRYANGQVAAHQPITVVYRGTTSEAPLYVALSGSGALPNPITTDAQGNAAFYADEGVYDFLALGARVPFDIVLGGGSGGDAFSEFIQVAPAATWIVPNPLGRTPAVGVIVSGELIIADVEYGDNGTITVTHAVPTAGKVILT